ncbi:MAG: hypothetical protein ACF8XB_22505, partial [Planctomycetota bacterium JB042]
MRSIRGTLTASLVAGGLLASLGAGVVFHAEATAALEAQFDETLVTRARALAALLEEEGGKVGFEFVPAAWPEYMGGEAPEYFQIRIEARDLVLRSPTLRVGERPGDLPRGVAPDGSPLPSDLRFPDGRAGRTLGLEVVVPRDGDEDDGPSGAPDGPDALDGASAGDVVPARRPRTVALVLVARYREELDRTLAALRHALLAAGGILGAAALVVVALAVRRGLRPLAAFGEEVARLDATTLSRRIPDDDLPAELVPTAAKLNELLER